MRSAAAAVFVLSALVLLLAARYFPFSHQKLGRQNQKQGQEQQQEKKKKQAKESEKIQHQQDQFQHLIYKKQLKEKEKHLQNIQRQMEIQNLIEFFKRKQQQKHLNKEEEQQQQQMTEQEKQTLDAMHGAKRAAREHFSRRLKRLQQFCQSPRNESL